MAQIQTFHLDAGSTFTQQLVYTDDNGDLFDLTGYTATLQLRQEISSPTVALDIDLDIDVPTATLSFEITAEQSSTLTAPRYYYGIELYAPDETVTRVLEGSFKVSPEVVR
jgi:hypothetical protein